MPQSNTKKNRISFLFALAVFAFICFIRHFKFYIDDSNTTFFALSYDYGFIPRGLMGTIYQFVVDISDKIDFNYMGIFNFNGIFTLLYYVLLFIFYKICLKRCKEENKRNLIYLITFVSIFAFSMFTTDVLYGSLDLHLNILLILGVIILLSGQFEWLLIPIGIIAMCINHDFLFTNANLLALLLLYQILTGDANKQKKRIVVLTTFLISTIVLFGYFETYNYANATTIAQEVEVSAQQLSETGTDYNYTYVNTEILGQDFYETGAYKAHHQDNKRDIPVFLVLFAPYIFFGIRFFVRLIKDHSFAPKKRVAYLALLCGGLAMLPVLLTDVYYGRYAFNLFFYYLTVFIFLLTANDTGIANGLNDLKADLKKISPLTAVWFIYPLFITPFRSVAISGGIHTLADIIYDPELSFFFFP